MALAGLGQMLNAAGGLFSAPPGPLKLGAVKYLAKACVGGSGGSGPVHNLFTRPVRIWPA